MILDMRMLGPHSELTRASRLPVLAGTSSKVSVIEWIILIGTGVTAALASTLVDFHLRIPGHAILKAVLPITMGLALVPRKGAGTVMSSVALVSAFSLRQFGFGGSGLGFGALTSLTLIGPILDITLRNVKSGLGIYWALAVSGLLTNFLAFAVRGTLKWTGMEHVGKPLSVWLSSAVVTYTLCGLVAGLLSACILFYARPSLKHREDSTQVSDQ